MAPKITRKNIARNCPTHCRQTRLGQNQASIRPFLSITMLTGCRRRCQGPKDSLALQWHTGLSSERLLEKMVLSFQMVLNPRRTSWQCFVFSGVQSRCLISLGYEHDGVTRCTSRSRAPLPIIMRSVPASPSSSMANTKYIKIFSLGLINLCKLIGDGESCVGHSGGEEAQKIFVEVASDIFRHFGISIPDAEDEG
jgi:hypothetical protein